jgi:trehalose 6-phosphate synthase
MSRVISVSNRVALPREGNKAAGGLAVGVLAALNAHGGVWFGWSGRTTASEPPEAKLTQSRGIVYATIDLNEQEFAGYYNGFSNNSLWPLCHYLLGFFSFSRSDYEAYCRVNELFARRIAPLLEPDDLIWVHDYHLIPLAAALRRAGVANPIGFFLHVPFPDFEVLRALPPHEHILRSLAAYDVVGFQTPNDLRSFQQGMTQPGIDGELIDDNLIRAYGRTFLADTFPIGVDLESCVSLAREHMSDSQVQRFEKSIEGRRLLIGVDRLDYSKGLTLRFQGYERLLEKYPTNRRHVTFVQIAPPTRTGVRAYDEIRWELERTAGHINGRFAEIDWVPIRYLNKGYRREVLMAMMRVARIGLVTPIRDGMNLVAKEYVAVQNPDDPGVLVLSPLAGAAHELKGAVLVNPYDRDAVADAIQRALEMPLAERRERHASMMAVLRRNDIHAWSRRFLETLQSVEARH